MAAAGVAVLPQARVFGVPELGRYTDEDSISGTRDAGCLGCARACDRSPRSTVLRCGVPNVRYGWCQDKRGEARPIEAASSRKVRLHRRRRWLWWITTGVAVAVLVILGQPVIICSLPPPGSQYAGARSGLLDIVARQERYFFDHGRYTSDLTELGFTVPMRSEGGRWAFFVERAGEHDFSAHAIRSTGKAGPDDGCFVLTIASANHRHPASCW